MKRLIAILGAVLLLSSVAAPAVFAAPTFVYHVDDDGANDEPGQKDLTAQSADEDGGLFYTSWKWDELSFSGKNTGDGCSLFDTDDDTFVNYALCATVGGGQGAASATLLTATLYECTADNRVDRCAGPNQLVFLAGADAAQYCTVADGPGSFDATDTVIVCNLSGIASEAGLTVIGAGTLVNTCSYPSREPNSDPSDCVITIPAADTTTVTTPGGSATFTATLTDRAQITPAAAGSVVFKLFSDSLCQTQVGGDLTDATDATGLAEVSTTVTVAGTYYWTADFTPTDTEAFNPSASACGSEVITVTAPTVQ